MLAIAPLMNNHPQQSTGIVRKTNCTDSPCMAERSAMPVNILNDPMQRAKESRITRPVERTSDDADHLQSLMR